MKKKRRTGYISYWRTWMSDLELCILEIKLEAKGYVRIPDRGEFVIFKIAAKLTKGF